jgi:hypothetical protein
MGILESEDKDRSVDFNGHFRIRRHRYKSAFLMGIFESEDTDTSLYFNGHFRQIEQLRDFIGQRLETLIRVFIPILRVALLRSESAFELF